jgi:hypothetical protein
MLSDSTVHEGAGAGPPLPRFCLAVANRLLFVVVMGSRVVTTARTTLVSPIRRPRRVTNRLTRFRGWHGSTLIDELANRLAPNAGSRPVSDRDTGIKREGRDIEAGHTERLQQGDARCDHEQPQRVRSGGQCGPEADPYQEVRGDAGRAGIERCSVLGVHQNRGAACAATPVSPSSETTKSLRRAGR